MEDVLEKYLYLAFVIIAVVFNIIRRVNKKKKQADTPKKDILSNLQELIQPKPSYEETEYEESFENESSNNYYSEELQEELVEEDLQAPQTFSSIKKATATKIDAYNGIEGTSDIKDNKDKTEYGIHTEVLEPIIGPEDFSDTDKLKKAFLYSEIFKKKEY